MKKNNLGSTMLSLALVPTFVLTSFSLISTFNSKLEIKQEVITSHNTLLHKYSQSTLTGSEVILLLNTIYENNLIYPDYSIDIFLDSTFENDSVTTLVDIQKLRNEINVNSTYIIEISKQPVDGLIQEIHITNLSAQEIQKFNSNFEKYFGSSVPGEKVIELLNLVANNNIEKTNKIGIDPSFTSRYGNKVTGQNNNESYYIKNNLIPLIDTNRNYIVKVTSLSIAYSKEGYIQRISIADESTLSKAQTESFNQNFEKYFGENVLGKDVKNLIKAIKAHNEHEYKNAKTRYVRIWFHIDSRNSNDNKSHYMLTGIGNPHLSNPDYLLEEINFIKEDTYYYVNVHQYNPDETIYSIDIADSYNKAKYLNEYK